MKKNILLAISIMLFTGCAGKTTDPRKGGLFSYNPNAYEKRLNDREQKLESIDSDTNAQKRKSDKLKRELEYEKSKRK